MFKVMPYKFSYYLNKLDEIESKHTEIEWLSISSYWTNGKEIIWKISYASMNSQTWKSYFHIQANYENDITKDIVDNSSMTEVWKLNHNQTILDDVFLVFCFQNERYNINERESNNRMKWLLYIIYEWRINLPANLIHIIESYFTWDVFQIQPLVKNAITPISDILSILNQIELRALNDRTGRKTDLSIVWAPELITLKYGALNIQTIALFIEEMTTAIQSVLSNTNWNRIIKKVNIWGNIRELEMEGGEYIVRKLPLNLQLTDQQQEILNELKIHMISSRDSNSSDNETIKEYLIRLVNSILSV